MKTYKSAVGKGDTTKIAMWYVFLLWFYVQLIIVLSVCLTRYLTSEKKEEKVKAKKKNNQIFVVNKLIAYVCSMKNDWKELNVVKLTQCLREKFMQLSEKGSCKDTNFVRPASSSSRKVFFLSCLSHKQKWKKVNILSQC